MDKYGYYEITGRVLGAIDGAAKGLRTSSDPHQRAGLVMYARGAVETYNLLVEAHRPLSEGHEQRYQEIQQNMKDLSEGKL